MNHSKTKSKNNISLKPGQLGKLIDFVKSFNEIERIKEFPEGYLNRNGTDVLAHLHHWHPMVLDWYLLGMAGNKPDTPANGYT